MANSRIDYPTVQVTNGFKGKAVKLETRNTGDFGAMVKMYIAAGNLFIGTFEVENALTNPRKATNFGFQFYKHPIALKGHYKFKAGEVYSVEGQPQTGKRINVIFMLLCMRQKIILSCSMVMTYSTLIN